MRILGLFLLLAGVLMVCAGVVIGVPFTAVFLLGFVGTAGREAGGDLALFLGGTVAACAVGYGLIVLGRRLRAG